MWRILKKILFYSTAIVMGIFWLGALPASAATCGPDDTGKTLDELLVPGSSIAANGLVFGDFRDWLRLTESGPDPEEICVYPLEDDPDTCANDPGLRFEAAAGTEWIGTDPGIEGDSWTRLQFTVRTEDGNPTIKGVTLKLTDFDVDDPDAVGGVAVAEDVYVVDSDNEVLALASLVGCAESADGECELVGATNEPYASAEFAPQGTLEFIEKITTAGEDTGDGQVSLRQFEQRFTMTGGNPCNMTVAVDIKPRGCKNRLNVKWKWGYVSVGILGTGDLDVTQIDPASVMLDGVPASRWKYRDVTRPVERTDCGLRCTKGSRDGYRDLILKFRKRKLIMALKALGYVEHKACYTLELSGEMKDGTRFKGGDAIHMLNKKKNKKNK